MVRGITPPHNEKSGIGNLSGTARFGDIAYLPGSGPADQFCSGCVFMVHSRGAKIYGRCKKAAELRNTDLSEISYVDRGTAACKFFEARPEGVKPWEGMPNDSDDVGDPAEGDSAGEA